MPLGTKQIDCLDIILFTNVSEDVCHDPGSAHGRHENGQISEATTTFSKTQNKRSFHSTHASIAIPLGASMILLFSTYVYTTIEA